MIPTEVDLSERECEILKLVATGASNKQIAQDLFISTNTVKVHLRNIFAKIGVTSRTEATLYAIREGVVPAPNVQASQAITIDESDEALDATVTPPVQRSPAWLKFSLYGVAFLAVISIIGFSIRQVMQPQVQPTQTTTSLHWQNLAPMPSARSGLAATVYEDQIFAIGGETTAGVSGEVDAFTPSGNKWQTLGEKTTPVADISAGSVGGKIYVPGGRLASGRPTDLLEVYDPILHRWEERAKMPYAVSAYSLAALDGEIYVFGGWDGTKALATAMKYNPENDVWQQLAPMSVPRAYSGAAVVDGKIYIIGGKDGKKLVDVNEIYSPEHDVKGDNPWELGKPMPQSRDAICVATIANIIYVIGGEGSGNSIMMSLQPDQGEWRKIDVPLSQPWSRFNIVARGTQIYAMGGKVADQPDGKTMMYQAIYIQGLPIVR